LFSFHLIFSHSWHFHSMFSIFRFKKIDFVSILLIFWKFFNSSIFNLIKFVKELSIRLLFSWLSVSIFWILHSSLFRKIFWLCLFCIFVHFFDFVVKKVNSLISLKFFFDENLFFYFVTSLVLWFSNFPQLANFYIF